MALAKDAEALIEWNSDFSKRKKKEERETNEWISGEGELDGSYLAWKWILQWFSKNLLGEQQIQGENYQESILKI